MMPIEADSVMNQLLYPAPAVFESHNQLDKLPAPAGHPVFEGKPVSAFDPEGAASFNVGAFTRKPTINGRNVVCELVVDVDVANRCNEGKEIINRIKSKQRMGVSTGLTALVEERNGRKGDREYYGVVNNIKFDHVAILLSEPPAGEFTYTLNSSEFFNRKQKGKSVMRDITINTSDLSLEDHKVLEGMAANPAALVNALNQNVGVERASEIVTNSGLTVTSISNAKLQEYDANKEAFEAFKVQLNEKRKEKVEFVLSNSKMTKEQLTNMSEEALDSLVDSVAPSVTHIMNGEVQEPVLDALEGA